MFPVEGEEIFAKAPPGLDPHREIEAAAVDGTDLFPIPDGWVVFFDTAPREPGELIGSISLVRYAGGGDRTYLRTIRRGSGPQVYTLQSFQGVLTEDVEIITAMEVVSMAAPQA